MNIQKTIEKLEERKRNSQKFWVVIEEIVELLPCEKISCISPEDFYAEKEIFDNKWKLYKDFFTFGIKNGKLKIFLSDGAYWSISDFLASAHYINFQSAIQSYTALLKKLVNTYTGNEVDKLQKIKKILEEEI